MNNNDDDINNRIKTIDELDNNDIINRIETIEYVITENENDSDNKNNATKEEENDEEEDDDDNNNFDLNSDGIIGTESKIETVQIPVKEKVFKIKKNVSGKSDENINYLSCTDIVPYTKTENKFSSCVIVTRGIKNLRNQKLTSCGGENFENQKIFQNPVETANRTVDQNPVKEPKRPIDNEWSDAIETELEMIEKYKVFEILETKSETKSETKMVSKSETKSKVKPKARLEAKSEAKLKIKLGTQMKSKHKIILWLMNIVMMVILLHKSHYDLLQSDGSMELFDPGSDGKNGIKNEIAGRDRDGIGLEIGGMENYKIKMKFKVAVKTIEDDDSIGSMNFEDSIGGGNDKIKMIDDRNSDCIGVISNDDNNYFSNSDSIGGISSDDDDYLIRIKSGNDNKCIKHKLPQLSTRSVSKVMDASRVKDGCYKVKHGRQVAKRYTNRISENIGRYMTFNYLHKQQKRSTN